jgi:MarR family 2-MHQ and catechol resistance regulon transcriptional repressor
MKKDFASQSLEQAAFPKGETAPAVTSAASRVPRTIEQEIRQVRPFASPQHKAVVNLLFSSGWLTEQIRAVIQPFGLTLQQYNVLRILRGADKPLSTCDIRDRMLDRMSDTSRLVNRLEKKGWVKRQVCITDRRLVDVTITAAGRKKLQAIDEKEDSIQAISSALSERDAETLSKLLDKLRSSC